MTQDRTGRVAIIVASITAVGGLGAAAISNWDNLFGTKNEAALAAPDRKEERLAEDESAGKQVKDLQEKLAVSERSSGGVEMNLPDEEVEGGAEGSTEKGFLAASYYPRTWEGTYVYRSKTRPIVIQLESYSEGAFGGKMLLPEDQNSIVTIRGTVVEDFSDFVEKSKWQYVDGFPSAAEAWLRFTTVASIQGRGARLNVVFYAGIGKDGHVHGVSFESMKAAEPYTSFNISPK